MLSITITMVFAVTGQLAPNTDTIRAPSLSVSELKEAIRVSQSRIRSLSVEYQSSESGAEGRANHGVVRKEVRSERPDHLYVMAAHGDGGIPWNEDPNAQIDIVNGGDVTIYYPFSRTCMHSKIHEGATEAPGTLKREIAFIATGIWLIDGLRLENIDGEPASLVQVANSAEYSSVRPRLERIDGNDCYVLENPGRSALWIDANRGACLLMREWYSKSDASRSVQVRLSKHREVSHGVWLPMRIEISKKKSGQVLESESSAIDVVSASVNSLSDGAFEFDPLPGTLDTTLIPEVRQIRDGGYELLDQIADWVVRHESVINVRSQNGEVRLITYCSIAGVVGAMAALLGPLRALNVAVLCGLGRRKRRSLAESRGDGSSG